jgi:hypothetical protein
MTSPRILIGFRRVFYRDFKVLILSFTSLASSADNGEASLHEIRL